MTALRLSARRPQKYHAVSVVQDGIRFGSLKEARRYQELVLMQAAGIVRNLEPHPAFDLWVLAPNGEVVSVGTYTADAKYDLDVDGTWQTIVEDTKSPPSRTEAYRLRKRIVEAIYGIRVTEV